MPVKWEKPRISLKEKSIQNENAGGIPLKKNHMILIETHAYRMKITDAIFIVTHYELLSGFRT
jgi:hypothetical protein